MRSLSPFPVFASACRTAFSSKLSKRFGPLRRAGPAAAVLLLAFGPAPAWATASLRCFSGPPVGVEVLGNLSHGLGNRLLSLEVSLDAAATGAEQDLARHTFTIEDMTQLWLDDETFRLQLYWERGGNAPRFGSSEVTILAKVKPDEKMCFPAASRS